MSDGPATLPPGATSLGGIEFDDLAFIGRVGDGLVYTARLDGQPVRIREYAPEGIVKRGADGGLEPTDESYRSAWIEAQGDFLELADELAAIRHPAVPRVVHSFAAENGQRGAYLVTRPSGPPLAATLAAGTSFTPDQVMRFATDLSEALAALHAEGIAHLDIAAETVSVAAGRLELTDLAIDNRPFIALAGRQDGFVRPGYSPIERADAASTDPLGPATDIYAASALLYRLIEGRDPAPWEERWRDPKLASLPDRDPYPPPFLAAIRTGLAIEPAQRFPDAAAWRDALALAPNPALAPARQMPAQPTPTPPMPTANWVVPLLVVLILGALAGLVYLAYAQGWFDRADQPTTTANTVVPAPNPRPAPEPVPVPQTPPALAPGSSVAGSLSASDRRNAAGAFTDDYIIDARGGERLELRLSSSDFDPVLSIAGPGLSDSNDDDTESGRQDSRLDVTLPRAGRYVVTVTSYGRGETGAYLLQVANARPDPPKPDDVTTVDLSSASRLSGRWHGEDDPRCEEPAFNIVAGERLISRIGGQMHTHRILEAANGIIRTEAIAGPAEGRTFTFRLAPDGESYQIEGETWIRC